MEKARLDNRKVLGSQELATDCGGAARPRILPSRHKFNR